MYTASQKKGRKEERKKMRASLIEISGDNKHRRHMCNCSHGPAHQLGCQEGSHSLRAAHYSRVGVDEGNRSCVLLSHQCHFQDLPGYPHAPPGQGLTKLRAVELAEHQGSGAEGETFVNECDGVSLFTPDPDRSASHKWSKQVWDCYEGCRGRLSEQLLRLVAEILQCHQLASHLAKSATDDKMRTDKRSESLSCLYFLN